MRRLTPEEITRRRAIVARVYTSTETLDDAAAEIGISRYALIRFIDKHAWDLRPGPSRVRHDHPLYDPGKGREPVTQAEEGGGDERHPGRMDGRREGGGEGGTEEGCIGKPDCGEIAGPDPERGCRAGTPGRVRHTDADPEPGGTEGAGEPAIERLARSLKAFAAASTSTTSARRVSDAVSPARGPAGLRVQVPGRRNGAAPSFLRRTG